MKRALIVLLLLLLSGSLIAQVPYFHWAHPNYKNYKEYNSYKPDEIEIKQWRYIPREAIEKELQKLNYPLTSSVGPFDRVDVNGKHTYIKKEFKPRFGVIEVPGPLVLSDEFEDDGLYRTRKLIRKPIKVDQPLCIASGKLKGSVLTKLIIVYEKCEKGWVCYDAYWKFVKPPPKDIAADIRAAQKRGATKIHISPLHGLPVGRPKLALAPAGADMRTMEELLRDLEKNHKKYLIKDHL